MKYKILKGTKLFDSLATIKKQMDAGDKAAQALVKEVCAESYAKSSAGLAGGIRAFYFKDGEKVPDGWKKMEKGATNWFFPKSSKWANDDILKKIAELPVVKPDALIKLLQFSAQVYAETDALIWVSSPKVIWRKTYILVAIPEQFTYVPVKDMQEITVSEYNMRKKSTL